MQSHLVRPLRRSLECGLCLVLSLLGLGFTQWNGRAQGALLPGSVIAWGARESGPIPPPNAAGDVIQVAGNGMATLALRMDGTVVGLDLPEFRGIRQIAMGPSIAVGLRAGRGFSAAILDSRGYISRVIEPDLGSVSQVACRNQGDVFLVRWEGTVARWSPFSARILEVPGVDQIVRVSVSQIRMLALRRDGTVMEWVLASSEGPTAVAGLRAIRSVAAGWDFSAALGEDGTVFTWGAIPPAPMGLNDAVDIAAGDHHLLVLRGDGSVLAWGDNTRGQTNVPAQLSGVTAIAAGPYSSMVISTGTPPVIRTSPVSVHGGAQYSAQFEVDAFGSQPLAFQWSLHGKPIPGANKSRLEIWPIRPEDEGVYVVRITNAFGSVRPVHAELAIDPFQIAMVGARTPNDIPMPGFLSHISSVAAGSRHTLALREDGFVLAWGANESGQCKPPPEVRGVVRIAAGGSHSVGLRADGTVVAWGDDSVGQCSVPPGLVRVRSVAVGVRHNLALIEDGSVVAWGSNHAGECVVPAGLSNVVCLSAGQEFSAAVRYDGSVVVWGRNPGGRLTPPARLGTVNEIAAGWYHLVALLRDGTVTAWGDNRSGQTDVPGQLRDVTAIGAGEGYSVTLKNNGKVEFWGAGPGSPLEGVAAFGAGARHLVALASPPSTPARVWKSPVSVSRLIGEPVQLSVKARGTWPIRFQWFKDGVLLPGLTNAVIDLPAVSPADSGVYWVEVVNAYGRDTSLVGVVGIPRLPAGTVLGWGSDFNSQVTPPEGLDTVRGLAAGNGFSVAVRQDGTVVAWGDASLGRTAVPAALSGVRSVSAGDAHAIALLEDGTLKAWGDDQFGQCRIPTGLNAVVAVSAGAWHSLALRGDGMVVAWGSDKFGQARPPEDLPSAMAIAGGGRHSLALAQAGTVRAWGDNAFRQIEVPEGLREVTAIAAGSDHSIALRTDGTVVCWGRNRRGQCTPPDGLAEVGAIAAGDEYSVARLRNGHLVAWGHVGRIRIPRQMDGGSAVVAGWNHALVLRGPPEPRLRLQSAGGTARLEFQVTPGWRYRLEKSSDLRNWDAAGPVWIAPGAVVSIDVAEPDPDSFLRLATAP